MSADLSAKAELIREIGGREKFSADWGNKTTRFRRLLAEFIGMYGLTFVLSGGAATLATWGGGIPPFANVVILSLISALWLTAAIYFLGDISAHFNPAMTLAFALRGDMGWIMAGAYWLVQFAAAAAGSLTALAFFGTAGNLAATRPQSDAVWQAVGFEAILTGGLVLMVLGIANGPKLNGQFVPLAVGAYILAFGTMGGLFEGAAMNPARAFGPDLALMDLSTWWVYLLGPCLGALGAVGVAKLLRGPATSQEAMAAMGNPHSRDS
jgi:glycerol uptake facilitator-like aquaporin